MASLMAEETETGARTGPDRQALLVPASRADLAIGLQLLRVSNLKTARLHLAMLRRDRRQALEALDGLVQLDGEIAILVDDMPPPDHSVRDLDAIGRWIEDQKRILASEKLTLISGADGPGMRSAPAPLADTGKPEPEPGPEPGNPPAAREAAATARPAPTVAYVADDRAAPQSELVLSLSPDLALLHEDFTALDTRMRRLPGRLFIAVAVTLILLLLGVAILYSDQLRPYLPDLMI